MNWIYYVGMGSNLGDKKAYLKKALTLIVERESVYDLRVSSLIETRPWGLKKQPTFLNGGCQFTSSESPEEILKFLQEIEMFCERERTVKWGPRTLDLDILCAFDERGQQIYWEEEQLKIPHPYLWERSFALIPLAELLPSYTYGGQSIQERIQELQGEA